MKDNFLSAMALNFPLPSYSFVCSCWLGTRLSRFFLHVVRDSYSLQQPFISELSRKNMVIFACSFSWPMNFPVPSSFFISVMGPFRFFFFPQTEERGEKALRDKHDLGPHYVFARIAPFLASAPLVYYSHPRRQRKSGI